MQKELIVLLLALAPVVCPAQEPVAGKSGTRSGVVFVIDGVGGGDVLGCVSTLVFPRVGVPHEIRVFEWTHGRGKILRDLQDHRYLMKKAKSLSDEVERYRTANPGCPVYLLAKSGGAGLALAAAELLPSDCLERIVLLSPAVAPSYDLRPALRAAGQIVSFYSHGDYIILGLGTSQFGTVDRRYGPAAGLLGFDVPAYLAPGDRKLYDRLVQVSWKPEMIMLGHLGTHLGTSMPGFLHKQVAPWLMP
ncbi:MAG: hypothetical protein AB7K24_06875 [Gemmataceae bacterium]